MLDHQGNKTALYNEIRKMLWGHVDNRSIDMHIRAIMEGAYSAADAIQYQEDCDNTGPDGEMN